MIPGYSVEFFFKKLVGPFFFPLSLCMLLFLFGLVLLWFTRKQKSGKIFASLGFAAAAVFGYGLLDNVLLYPLEYKYPSLSIKNIDSDSNIRWVVFLGGGKKPDPGIPPTGQLSRSSLARLVEGIRIFRYFPDSKLVLSGGGAFDPLPEATVMAQAAVALGVEESRLVLETGSNDTREQARLLSPTLGDDPFVLVTSASHMPRSMMHFQGQGMRPTPAPTDYHVTMDQPLAGFNPGALFPGVAGFERAQLAIHEYLGIAWAKLLHRCFSI